MLSCGQHVIHDLLFGRGWYTITKVSLYGTFQVCLDSNKLIDEPDYK